MLEERSSELEERKIQIVLSSREKNRLKKKINSLKDLWGYNRRSNICVKGVSEGEKK